MSLLCLKRFFNIRIHFEVCHLSMPVTEKLLYFCYYKFYMTTLAHQFSLSMVFDSLQPHGLQHARLSCPSTTPGACSNSRASIRVMPFNHLILCRPLLLLPPIFPASGSFQMSQCFESGARVLELQLQHQSFQ